MAITRLNNNSITSVTTLPSGIDVGKVVQVLQAITNTNTQASSSTWVDLNGCSITITPTTSTSKFLLTCSIQTSLNATTSHQEVNSNIRYVKNGAALYGTNVWSGYSIKMPSARVDHFARTTLNVSYLDTSSHTTADITFKIQGVSEQSGEVISFAESNSTSFFQVMEILA